MILRLGMNTEVILLKRVWDCCFGFGNFFREDDVGDEYTTAAVRTCFRFVFGCF